MAYPTKTTTSAAHTSPPAKQETPVTVKAISDHWFLVVALVSIVAYLVRLEISASSNRQRLDKLENDTIPATKKEVKSVEDLVDCRIKESRTMFSAEITNALENQKLFLQSRFDLLLEKLSLRDAAIADLKEKANRHGQEMREVIGYCKHVDQVISKD